MNTASSLFQEVSPETISQLFAAALHGEPVREAALLDGGMFNTTYLVAYGARRRRAVLRLGPVNRERLLGFERNLMRAEEYVYSVCHSLGLPCSTVLACDCSRSLIDRDFMIVEYIPSVVMSEAGLDAGRRRELYLELGGYLKRLHSVEGESFGFVSRILEGRRFSRWSEALCFEIEDFTARLESRGGLDAAEAKAVRAAYYGSAALLDEISVPRLLHTDLWEGNVLLDRDTLGIKAVIDADRAVFGDPDFEFASPWGSVPPLREGYGLAWPPDEARERRMRLYLAFYLALEAHVGLTEYNNPDLYRDRKRQLMEVIASLDRRAGS